MAIKPEKYSPFANGSQFSDWQASNCERCKKYNEDMLVDDPNICEIDLALLGAYLDDGQVEKDIAQRMGFIDNREKYNWKCTEVDWTDAWKKEWEKINEKTIK
jgi:hypothetical protein